MLVVKQEDILVVTETGPNTVEITRAGAQGPAGGEGPPGPSITDGDKGDVVISASGATFTIDPTLLTTYMRGITASASEAAFKAAVNLEVGVDVQAYSAVLAATTASFLISQQTKLGHISVTQAVDLDAIETRVNALDAAVILKGVWDASAGTFPGSGTAQAGDSWIVSVAGTVGGVAFTVNDRIIAILDNASTTVFAANWFKADYTDQVLSVAGKTGAVTLQVADVTDMSANGRSLVSAADYAAMKVLLSLGNVTNTSDANKPVSTAQQTALNLKADLASPVLTGNPTAPTPAVGDNDTSLATTAFVVAGKSVVRAHKNAVDQTIPHNTVTTVTWSTEAFDTGSYFASNTYTPPAGPVWIDAAVTLTLAAASGILYVYIYRSGTAVRRVRADFAAAGTRTVQVSMADQANGTDTYDIRVYQASGSDATLLGAVTDSAFHGRAG